MKPRQFRTPAPGYKPPDIAIDESRMPNGRGRVAAYRRGWSEATFGTCSYDPCAPRWMLDAYQQGHDDWHAAAAAFRLARKA